MLFKLWKVSFQLFFLGKVLLIVSSMARKTKVALASHDGSHIGCLCETDVYLPLSPLLALQRCRRPPLDSLSLQRQSGGRLFILAACSGSLTECIELLSLHTLLLRVRLLSVA